MNMQESIRYYREKAGMRQIDLGQRLGVSAQAVSKWELGKAEPDRECIEKMCQIFGINSDSLLGIDHISFNKMFESLYQPDPLDQEIMDLLATFDTEEKKSLVQFLQRFSKHGAD